MRVTRKGIAIALLIITALFLLAAAGLWRLGLLPLLLYDGGGGSGLLRIIEGTPGKTAPSLPWEAATPEKNAGVSRPAPQNTPSPGEVDLEGKSPLQQEIEARHIARLREIAGSYEGRLNSLVAKAWSEYSGSSGKGDAPSLLALARKYIAQGEALESQCDARFYAALADFEAELRRHDLPTTTVEAARREYEWTKAARKKEILSAAFRHL